MHTIESQTGYYSEFLGTFYDTHCGTAQWPSPEHSMVKSGHNRHVAAE